MNIQANVDMSVPGSDPGRVAQAERGVVNKSLRHPGVVNSIIIKIKIRSSCEIKYFVETHLCKLCVILRSRVLRVVCPHQGVRSATPLGTTV